MKQLKIGDLLNDRYQIIDVIAKGGMGAVYAAKDISLAVKVAIKENLVYDEAASRQFQHEASILAGLRHANLPRVTDHFVIEGNKEYLVMDFIEGDDLKDILSTKGTFSEKEVVTIGAAICDALIYLHNLKPPVVHRDIKPGNIKISPDGKIFLVDFGLAKIAEPGKITTTGAQALTPGYASPEQYGQGTETRSDIYELGATLYALITGYIPEDGLARATGSTKLTPIKDHNTKVSAQLASVIEKALEVDIDKRYATAEEFKQRLLETVGGNDTSASGFLKDQKFYKREYPNKKSRTRKIEQGVIELHQSNKDKSKSKRRIIFLIVAIPLGFVFFITLFFVFRNQDQYQIAGLFQKDTEAVPLIISPENEITPTTSLETPLPGIVEDITETPVFIATKAEEVVSTPLGGKFGLIAYTSMQSGIPQIWIMNSNGKDKSQITNRVDGACQPDWSPDGSKIVFISPCQKRNGIDIYTGTGMYVINADGTGITPLYSVPGGDYDPNWSPDGKYIAFASKRDGISHIYLYNLADHTTQRLTGPSSYDRRPVWSPDGSVIAFESTRLGVSQIWIMNADGTDVHEFSNLYNGAGFTPSWSQDGNILIFSQGLSQARLVGKQTSSQSTVEAQISDYLSIWRADYSEDGLWIVFEMVKDENRDIYIMNSNGGELKRLTDDSNDDFDPVWLR